MNACVGANMSSRLTCLCINELTKRLKGKILSGEKKFNFETLISIQNGSKALVEVRIMRTKRFFKLICATSKSFVNTTAVP